MITENNSSKTFDVNSNDVFVDGSSLDTVLRHYRRINTLIHYILDSHPDGWKTIKRWDDLRSLPFNRDVSVTINNPKEKGFRQDYLTDTSNVTMIPNPKNQGYYVKIELDGIKYEMNKVFPFEDDENNKAIVKITDVSKTDKIMFAIKMRGSERTADKIYLNTDDTFHVGDEIRWKEYKTKVVYIIRDDQGRTNYVCDFVYE